MKAIDVALMLLMLVVLLTFCTGCGPRSSTHTVQGEATVKIVVSVDTTVCDDLPTEDKQECIKSLVDLATAATKTQQETGFSGIY